MKVERTKAILGLASCLVLLSAQAATYLHLATVRHVACPEHGELVEVSAATAHAHPPGVSESGSEGGAVSHQHDHCLFGLQARAGATPSLQTTFIAQASPATFVAVLRDVHAAPAPDLLAAPKQSPPTV